MIWCFYFRFMKAVMARRRLIFVEVMDQSNSEFYISRYQAKQNLHLVSEITQKLRSYNYLFDKYWYMQREYTYIEDINHVEQNQFNNKLLEIAANNQEKDDQNAQGQQKNAENAKKKEEEPDAKETPDPTTPGEADSKPNRQHSHSDESKDSKGVDKIKDHQDLSKSKENSGAKQLGKDESNGAKGELQEKIAKNGSDSLSKSKQKKDDRDNDDSQSVDQKSEKQGETVNKEKESEKQIVKRESGLISLGPKKLQHQLNVQTVITPVDIFDPFSNPEDMDVEKRR